jgi:Probable taurine catabolism dioxygenase
MWDNLLVQHYAVADYGDAPRKMLRATLTGTRWPEPNGSLPANTRRPPIRDGGQPLARSPIFKPNHTNGDRMLYEQIDTAVIDGDSLPWVPLTPIQMKSC